MAPGSRHGGCGHLRVMVAGTALALQLLDEVVAVRVSPFPSVSVQSAV
jgi:hypothetical protein